MYGVLFEIILTIVRSAKILLLPPEYEIIMVPSNHSLFQYCDSNIGLFSIAPCKVITLNLFWYQFFASSFMALSLKLSLFLSLKGDSEKIVVTFRNTEKKP